MANSSTPQQPSPAPDDHSGSGLHADGGLARETSGIILELWLAPRGVPRGAFAHSGIYIDTRYWRLQPSAWRRRAHAIVERAHRLARELQDVPEGLAPPLSEADMAAPSVVAGLLTQSILSFSRADDPAPVLYRVLSYIETLSTRLDEYGVRVQLLLNGAPNVSGWVLQDMGESGQLLDVSHIGIVPGYDGEVRVDPEDLDALCRSAAPAPAPPSGSAAETAGARTDDAGVRVNLDALVALDPSFWSDVDTLLDGLGDI